MASNRLKVLLLAILVAVLAVAMYRAWPAGAGSSATGSTAPGAAGTAAQEPPPATFDVQLEALEAKRPELGAVNRNLFEFELERTPQQVEPDVSRPVAETRPVQISPPAEPPIPLKFIGLVEVPERALVIAVLSDEHGVYHGREGEIVEGRYRIWRIGAESIEVSRLDGSGRQTIRLSGS